MATFTATILFNEVGNMIERFRRNQILGLMAFILVVSTALSGCQKTSSWTKGSSQGVNVTIIHPNAPTKTESKGEGSPDTQNWKFVNSWAGENPGRVEVVIDNLRLQIDGQDYGTLKSGDTVTVDMMKGGKVTVNDQDRQPDPKK